MVNDDASSSGSMSREDHDRLTQRYYHVRTQLADGRPSLVIDPGSVGNLMGDSTAKQIAQTAARHGLRPTYEKRDRPLNVSGVGHGAERAVYDCTLPIALRRAEGEEATVGTMTTPTITNSQLPGLLGLSALRKNRAILDLNTMRMHFTGPGNYDIERALPSGSQSYQCELAPSGHMVVPCCEYVAGTTRREDSELTLHTRSASEPPGLGQRYQ
jgi:hypothetical protein